MSPKGLAVGKGNGGRDAQPAQGLRGRRRAQREIGVVANWQVLLACLISAGNAASRYAFSQSSNAWLEIQWYLFAGMVVYILIGGGVFSLVLNGVGGKEWIQALLMALPGGQLGFLIFVNLFVFVVAFFLDFFEIAFILIPLLAPAAEKLGIDLIWFGMLIPRDRDQRS